MTGLLVLAVGNGANGICVTRIHVETLIDRCLLALKHLVSLQARTRPSVQAELDLYATADR
jgi:hypothetical protein